MVAGVCGGIAEYFGWDVTVVRLAFVLSIFLPGTQVIVYLLAWLIVPEAPIRHQQAPPGYGQPPPGYRPPPQSYPQPGPPPHGQAPPAAPAEPRPAPEGVNPPAAPPASEKDAGSDNASTG